MELRLPEKLIAAKVFKKFSALIEPGGRLSSSYEPATGSSSELHEPSPRIIKYFRSLLILSSDLYICLPCGLFASVSGSELYVNFSSLPFVPRAEPISLKTLIIFVVLVGE